MQFNSNNPKQGEPSSTNPSGGLQRNWLATGAWFVAASLAIVALVLGWQFFSGRFQSPVLAAKVENNASLPSDGNVSKQKDFAQVPLPTFEALDDRSSSTGIDRYSNLHTVIPNRPNTIVSQYTVDLGDSVFEIAARFNLKPESVLWANYEQLNDNPDLLSLGMNLNIPPVDGVLHIWKEGDSLDALAAQYQVKAEDILAWSGNQIDLVDPQIPAGTLIMIPGGKREYRQWIIPTIPRGRAGVSQALYGSGACEGSFEGAYGSGAFIWPAGNHVLSGNDYWDGHLAIDIAAGEGAPIYAADSGVVVFAGWATGGYGNMVMIDHGNGYQTLYAHLSSVRVRCGQSVSQGSTIGIGGSTGNSTGPHLHFEVRYLGGFVNPWYVLPAP